MLKLRLFARHGLLCFQSLSLCLVLQVVDAFVSGDEFSSTLFKLLLELLGKATLLFEVCLLQGALRLEQSLNLLQTVDFGRQFGHTGRRAVFC